MITHTPLVALLSWFAVLIDYAVAGTAAGTAAAAAGCLAMHDALQADGAVAEGFEGVGELFPPGLFDNGRPGRGEMALGWEQLSGRFGLVASLLHVLRTTSNDKCVLLPQWCLLLLLHHLSLSAVTSVAIHANTAGQDVPVVLRMSWAFCT